MKESIETNHVYYSGDEGEGTVKINGIIISFDRIVHSGDLNYLTLEYGRIVTGKIKRSKYPSIIKEIDKVNTFAANYQYCYQ